MLTDVLLCSLVTTVLASLALLGRGASPMGGHRHVSGGRFAVRDGGAGRGTLAVSLAAVPAIALAVAGEPLPDVGSSAVICAALSAAWLSLTPAGPSPHI